MPIYSIFISLWLYDYFTNILHTNKKVKVKNENDVQKNSLWCKSQFVLSQVKLSFVSTQWVEICSEVHWP